MAEKVTVMKLKVDLQCPSCYKKVKKILCKFPQIRDQVYDEKQNLVTITVLCCCPEKIREKLCCKGCRVIKSIEIVEPKPPPEVVVEPKKEPKKTKVKEDEKQKKGPEKKPQPEKTPEKPKKPERCPCQPVPVGFCCVPCSGGYRGGPCYYAYWPPPPPPPPQPCYCGCGYGYCHGRGYSRCDYFSEETTGGCTFM